MPDSRIQAVDHVNIEARLADAGRLEWFYGEVVQLDQLRTVKGSENRLCFKSESIELRVDLLDDPVIDGVAVRVTIAVPSLEDAEEMLRDNRMLVEKMSGLSSTDVRIHTLDPSGNRVELIRIPHWSPV